MPAMQNHRLFNQTTQIAEGWYWLLKAKVLKSGRTKAVSIVGYDLALYRGKDGQVVALDAYCPHMGAHLAEGRVEGNELRCFFHNWRFDQQGNCTDIPCWNKKKHPSIHTKSWHITECHGLIWIWLGAGEPKVSVPLHAELEGIPFDYALGNSFKKRCHPNVVMINAIDEQHFQTVHNLPGSILHMAPTVVNEHCIDFQNIRAMPTTNWIGKFLKRFYRRYFTYELRYCYGSVGMVTVGPDCLHLYLMFALKMTSDGRTEGQTLAFTRKRATWFGHIFNYVLLLITKLAGSYFALGDTRIFQSIRFHFKTPIAADRSVIAFMNHLEKQTAFPTYANQRS